MSLLRDLCPTYAAQPFDLLPVATERDTKNFLDENPFLASGQ